MTLKSISLILVLLLASLISKAQSDFCDLRPDHPLCFCNKNPNHPLCSPLPVTLIEFKYMEHEGRIVLEWSTAQEINNDYFQLEISRNGKNWKLAATVFGHGTSHDTNYYTYDISDQLFPGRNYVRLLQVDFDGIETYYNTLMIEVKDTEIEATTTVDLMGRQVESNSLGLVIKRRGTKVWKVFKY
jgi:hypothetical protein